MIRLETPEHAGSRDQAIALVAPLADDLSGTSVLLDCGGLVVATPSFLDELVKQILEQRHADRIDVLNPPDRAWQLLDRAATNRGVRARVAVAVPSG
jgi:hypothetical protein